MDLSCTQINLHPEAQVFLFQYYRKLKLILCDVLGHLEIDYMAIALLNPQNELFFLSSKPSLECNLIEHNIWQYDACFQRDFLLQGEAQVWEKHYPEAWRTKLLYYKQQLPGFSMGISVPSSFEEYRVVYSFALESTNEAIKKNIINNIDTLTNMGKFCLRKIIKAIPLPDRQRVVTVKKPSLRLIINNKVPHENNT